MELPIPGQAFHGRHLGPVRLDGEHEAGADRLAVDEHGAGAARSVLAADVGSGEPEVVAEEVDEQPTRLHAFLIRDPIDLHLDVASPLRHLSALSGPRAPRLASLPAP
jgi:hypothetical protein